MASFDLIRLNQVLYIPNTTDNHLFYLHLCLFFKELTLRKCVSSVTKDYYLLELISEWDWLSTETLSFTFMFQSHYVIHSTIIQNTIYCLWYNQRLFMVFYPWSLIQLSLLCQLNFQCYFSLIITNNKYVTYDQRVLLFEENVNKGQYT